MRKPWLAVLSVCFVLGACASTRGEPEPPPKPFYTVVVMPVVMQHEVDYPGSEGQGQSVARTKAPIVIPLDPASMAVAAVVNVISIASTAEANRTRQTLAEALDSIAFRPAGFLDARMKRLLLDRGIQVVDEAEGDRALSQATRTAGDYSAWRSRADAVLDVRVDDFSYDRSRRAGGYVPNLSVTAYLMDTTSADGEGETYGYWLDYRSNLGDENGFTSPASLTFESIELMTANASAARRDLEATLVKMADKLASDVRKRVADRPAAPGQTTLTQGGNAVLATSTTEAAK